MFLRISSKYFLNFQKPVGFYTGDAECFLQARNWIFKYDLGEIQALESGLLTLPVQLFVGIKMLQNSWESKTVNLRHGDGAASGLPKTSHSHLPPSQKLVALHAYF
jgi:hypothetical protein